MANNTYENFDNIMNLIIARDSSNRSINMNNFSGGVLDGFAQDSHVFWDGVLQYLQNEKDKILFDATGVGIRESMFKHKDVKGVAEFINENADLIDSFLDKCIKGTDEHWNEGFQRTLKLYADYFIGDEDGGEDNNAKNIINANAGNSFNNQKWVLPWTNIDDKNYSEVRGNDKIVRVLNNKNKLQFTQRLLNKYIRLLMPEYDREVQIEDLDRNFWVIGQTLMGILSFLFDDNSPLKNIIEGSLDELTQLWENLLYLWLGFAAIKQQIDEDYCILVVPFYKNNLNPYIKFDNFQLNSQAMREDLLKNCWEGLKYLPGMYNRSKLIIIPEIRDSATTENFYQTSIYPGIIIYSNNTGKREDASDGSASTTQSKLQYIEFYTNGFSYFRIWTNEGKRYISNIEYTYPIWYVSEKSPYYYISKDLTECQITGEPYVCSIRTLFDDFNVSENDDGIKISFKITCEDVVKVLCGISSEATWLFKGSFEKTITPSDTTVIGNISGKKNDQDISAPSNRIKITKGWYRGENPSSASYPNKNFDLTIKKTWENSVSNAEIEITAKDALGFEQSVPDSPIIFKQETSIPELIQTKKITVPAYSNIGELITYTMAEKPMENLYWKTTATNTQINYLSDSAIASFVNTWTGIEFIADIMIINKEYHTTDYPTLESFVYALTHPDNGEKAKWNSYVAAYVNSQKDNSGKIYCGRYQWYNSDGDSICEVIQFMTFVTKIKGAIQYYTYDYVLSESTASQAFHATVSLPYASASFDSATVPSTSKFCKWIGSTSPSAASVLIDKPSISPVTNEVTKGNIVYGTGAGNGIKVYYDNEQPYLYNFLILGQDRSCAGTNSTIGINAAKDIYPYYYKCTITKGAGLNGEHGTITAEFNTYPTKFGLTASGNKYQWAATDKRGYLSIKSDYPNEPDIHIDAQKAIGQFHTTFLNGSKSLLQAGE